MDRDDHALALTTRTLRSSTAVSFDDAFGRLPGAVKAEVLMLGVVMREIGAARFTRPACAAIAQRLAGRRGMSAENLRKLYEQWREIGAAALIDHRKCGGCGVEGCTQARERGLSKAVIATFKALCGGNNKQGMNQAWEVLIQDLCSNGTLLKPCTWETLHGDLFPGLIIPPRCPWSLSHPPPGWSRSTFLRHKPSKPLLDAMKNGLGAAWNHTPDVREDMTKLRFLERVYFDDHKLDCSVMVWDRHGKVQIVEMWGLFALDASTGAVIAFGLRPKLLRADGTTEGLTMRDMQHLIADILARYGYPTAYKMTLVVENAAAAVSAEMEELLLTRTHGQVVVQRTGVHSGDFLMRGFGERWGAPRGKAPMESWFHLLDIVLGFLKGQTGSNWTVKPGEHDGRVKIARAMAAIITAKPELEGKLDTPLHWSGEIHLLVTEAIKQINARTDHDLERHQVIVEFRWNESDEVPKPTVVTKGMPAHLEREVQEFHKLPVTTQAHFINSYGGTRRESPTEKVRRIHAQGKFTGIAPETLFDLMVDTATAKYKGADVLDVKMMRGKQSFIFRFQGEHGCMREITHGDVVSVRWNSDMPQCGAWVFGARDVFIAYLQYERDPEAMNADDVEILQNRLGRKLKAHKDLLTTGRKIAARLPAQREHEQRLDHDLEILSTLALEAPATIAAALPESADLARVVMSTKRTAKAPVMSDAESYLELIGKPEPTDDD